MTSLKADAQEYVDAARERGEAWDDLNRMRGRLETAEQRTADCAAVLNGYVGRNVQSRLVKLDDGWTVLIRWRGDGTDHPNIELFDVEGNLRC